MSAAEVTIPPLGGTETILLVADDLVAGTGTREMLERGGYTVLETRGGEAALSLAAGYRGPIHLLLTDVLLVGMPATTLVASLCAVRPKVRLLCMSLVAPEDLPAGSLPRDAGVLLMPFTIEVLAHRVRDVLDRD